MATVIDRRYHRAGPDMRAGVHFGEIGPMLHAPHGIVKITPSSLILAVFGAALVLASPPTIAATNGPVAWGEQKFDIRNFDKPFTKIAAGWAHTVALRADGTVVAWGNNL